jgi:hypothetical protein
MTRLQSALPLRMVGTNILLNCLFGEPLFSPSFSIANSIASSMSSFQLLHCLTSNSLFTIPTPLSIVSFFYLIWRPLSAPLTSFRCVRKNAKSDYKFLHVCPSFDKENIVPDWIDYHKMWWPIIFRNCVEKIQIY